MSLGTPSGLGLESVMVAPQGATDLTEQVWPQKAKPSQTVPALVTESPEPKTEIIGH